jgi:hypothetical protein
VSGLYLSGLDQESNPINEKLLTYVRQLQVCRFAQFAGTHRQRP